MARTTPRVERDTLIGGAADGSTIAIDTPAWFIWLEAATTFAFVGEQGSFTARSVHHGFRGADDGGVAPADIAGDCAPASLIAVASSACGFHTHLAPFILDPAWMDCGQSRDVFLGLLALLDGVLAGRMQEQS